jgi:excisionase family DNA binding protein
MVRLVESHALQDALVPKLALPFQQCEAIDVRRVAKVLAVSHRTVHYILKRGDLCGYRIGTSWRLEYSSLVDYCNRLRLHYGITEAGLLKKPTLGRLRDQDLLPFPLAETIYAAEVQKRLDIARATVSNLILQGDLIAYQPLIGSRSCPYRIYRPSFERYLGRLHIQAQSRFMKGCRV